jgi:hypothetical protein
VASEHAKANSRLFAAQFHECLMEFFATDRVDQWMLRLRHDSAGRFEFQLDVDNFAALCIGLKQCIDAALSPLRQPNAEMAISTMASGLLTHTSSRGAISIISDWSEDPNVQFNFYPDQMDRRSRTTLMYSLVDAMRLYDLFAHAYNNRGRA